MTTLTGRRWWVACGLTLTLALLALVPTTGDFGLTYDEPAYRYSQLLSVQWWERLGRVRSQADLDALMDPETLLYYWPYGRHGINFHPPLAGQLNLLTYKLFGGFLKDIPARRMASVIEFALTVTILFGFLARRYGTWVGGVAAASLLLMPRLYGQAHLIDTDIPGLFLWAATAVAFWKGLNEPNARRWRVLVGVLIGLAFVEKMGAVIVVLPTLAWMLASRLPRAFRRGEAFAAWLDGVLTTGLMLTPLGVAYLEIRRLAAAFYAIQQNALQIPPDRVGPGYTDLFRDHPQSGLLGLILAAPFGVWLLRRLLGRIFRKSPVWGRERPGLETFTAILAFAPLIAWLGNPAWWREALPRLAHYYAINTARRGALPNIQILYFGQIYEYSLPWHNAWVLLAITVPAGILAASLAGLVFVFARLRSDRLPLYFLVHLVTLPALRMLDTPAHDGVRLFLPTFFFLAAMAGWGLVWLADGLARLVRRRERAALFRFLLAGLTLGPAAWQLARIHPFELSYYNALIGGPRGAWERGFELSYWYDAFNPTVVDELNRKLPPGAHVDFPNDLSRPSTFQELQSLGELRGDIRLQAPEDAFCYLWLLTHDSKAMAYTRLLFAMEPWYSARPRQLGGLRVATVADPVAASRALALQLLTDAPAPERREPPAAPAWVRKFAPWLGRLWGDGLTKAKPLTVNEPMLAWAKRDPEGLRRAARLIVDWALADSAAVRRARRLLLSWDRNDHRGPDVAFQAAVEAVLARPPFAGQPEAAELFRQLSRYDGQAPFSTDLLRRRPEALADAVEILIRRPDDVRAVLLRTGFTDPAKVGGPLDQGLPR
jgi:4-amino-4-deoxy-L-arabinose transferase-like glycosyltransferase